MRRGPMLGDVETAANPYVVQGGDVVQETRQAECACRVSNQAHVQADGHHLWLRRPFRTEHVYRVFEKPKEIFGRRKDASAEFRIVVGEGIGHDQVALTLYRDPIG